MGKITVSAIYGKIKKLNTICAALAGLVLLFITFSIFIDVFLRYFFNKPSIWITEVSSYLFLYIIFLGTAYALQQGMHIRVTFLLDRFNDTLTRIINLVTSILAMIFSLALLWQTSVMTWSAFKEDWTSPTMLSAPYAYIYIVMVVGSFLLCLTFTFRTIIQFMGAESETGE
ncbi:MAG: TRAP transporter small permease [Deltaproteobacteria bacterium]|nr:TRAP transporter small permease [Deltaproteobacteria bacterium]